MQELIPNEPDFADRVLEYSDKMSEFLSEAATGLRGINRVPKKSNQKQRFMEALAEAFEVVGGVPRLALWADRNPTEFYKILGKQVPAMVQNNMQVNANGPVTIVSALPKSHLDEEDEKQVVEASFQEVKDGQ